MTTSLQVELDGVRAELFKAQARIEELMKGKYPERGEVKTLRDEFAMIGLQSVIQTKAYHKTALGLAEEAYVMADAMLEARKK